MELLIFTLLPHIFWITESEIEQRIGDPHDVASSILLTEILLIFLFLGLIYEDYLYLAEYWVVRTIFFTPYWSLRKYGHIYYLGGGYVDKIERWLGDSVRMYTRLFLIILYVWYILHKFAVI